MLQRKQQSGEDLIGSSSRVRPRIARTPLRTPSMYIQQPRTLSSPFFQFHVLIKGHSTILNNIFDSLETVEGMESEKHILNQIINATYGELLYLPEQLAVELTKLTPSIYTNQILSSLVRVGQLKNLIISQFDPLVSLPKQKHSVPAPQKSLLHGTKDCLICRICDESVPTELFEEHTISCVQAYKNEAKLKSLDDKLRQLRDDITFKMLDTPWPGMSQISIDITLPAFAIVCFINQSLEVDPYSPEAVEEITRILESLPPSLPDIVSKVRALILDRRKFIKAASVSSEVLRNTRVSGNSLPADTSLNIAHFQFIKRISSGAYARVFLARKVATGDIFAIKVIPKSSVRQRTQMQRVIAERDILLQFSNPYIVNFCMYSQKLKQTLMCLKSQSSVI